MGVGRVCRKVEGLDACVAKMVFRYNGCIDAAMGANRMRSCAAWRFEKDAFIPLNFLSLRNLSLYGLDAEPGCAEADCRHLRRRAMSDVVVFDEFDAWEFYQLCIRSVEDREYCKEVAKLALEVQVGQCAYCEEPQLRAVLQNYRRFAVVIDRGRRFAIIYLDVAVQPDVPEGELRPDGSRIVELLYERHGGGFRLKSVDWITPKRS